MRWKKLLLGFALLSAMPFFASASTQNNASDCTYADNGILDTSSTCTGTQDFPDDGAGNLPVTIQNSPYVYISNFPIQYQIAAKKSPTGNVITFRNEDNQPLVYLVPFDDSYNFISSTASTGICLDNNVCSIDWSNYDPGTIGFLEDVTGQCGYGNTYTSIDSCLDSTSPSPQSYVIIDEGSNGENCGTSTSTACYSIAQDANTSFGLMMIIVLISGGFVAWIWNTTLKNKKKPWQRY